MFRHSHKHTQTITTNQDHDLKQAADSVSSFLQVQLDGKTDVIVVGDTHGQLHDLLHMLDLTKAYAGDHIYVFNGANRPRAAPRSTLCAFDQAIASDLPQHQSLSSAAVA